MGDSAAPSTQESTDQVLASFIQRFPDLMRVQNAAVLPQAQTELAAAQAISPAYNDLLTSLYENSTPRLAAAGAKADEINRVGAANTDLNILRGPGSALVTEAQNLDKQLNPEFYKTRAATSDALGQLLASVNLNNANPEAERLVNQESLRTGNDSTPSATSSLSNALSFGDQLDKRRNSLNAALNTATGFLQPAQGQFNPVQTALNRNSSNSGTNQFAGVQKPGGQAYQSGQGFLNNVTSLRQQENDINANRRDVLDRFNEVTSSISV